jgi:type VI secretion system secreted protein Hcp
MGYQYYASFKGSKQGTFHGNGKDPRGKDWFLLESVHCGITAPWDVASGAVTGKRQHKPIVITREVDTTSPLLFHWCTNKESFSSIIIEIVAAEGNGWEHTTHTITLTNALITAIAPKGHQGKLAHDLTIDFDDATVTPGLPPPTLGWVRSWQDIGGIDFGYP